MSLDKHLLVSHNLNMITNDVLSQLDVTLYKKIHTGKKIQISEIIYSTSLLSK